uniref:Basic proline-rich protein n=1 Tax=Nonomuraea gerenzanensis TaxID=93944 RepID=A0A1M4E3X4_9ACTN|nr:Basic proline-rich protein precursor [Nonomuraea gerenzanensis]
MGASHSGRRLRVAGARSLRERALTASRPPSTTSPPHHLLRPQPHPRTTSFLHKHPPRPPSPSTEPRSASSSGPPRPYVLRRANPRPHGRARHSRVPATVDHHPCPPPPPPPRPSSMGNGNRHGPRPEAPPQLPTADTAGRHRPTAPPWGHHRKRRAHRRRHQPPPSTTTSALTPPTAAPPMASRTVPESAAPRPPAPIAAVATCAEAISAAATWLPAIRPAPLAAPVTRQKAAIRDPPRRATTHTLAPSHPGTAARSRARPTHNPKSHLRAAQPRPRTAANRTAVNRAAVNRAAVNRAAAYLRTALNPSPRTTPQARPHPHYSPCPSPGPTRRHHLTRPSHPRPRQARPPCPARHRRPSDSRRSLLRVAVAPIPSAPATTIHLTKPDDPSNLPNHRHHKSDRPRHRQNPQPRRLPSPHRRTSSGRGNSRRRRVPHRLHRLTQPGQTFDRRRADSSRRHFPPSSLTSPTCHRPRHNDPGPQLRHPRPIGAAPRRRRGPGRPHHRIPHHPRRLHHHRPTPRGKRHRPKKIRGDQIEGPSVTCPPLTRTRSANPPPTQARTKPPQTPPAPLTNRYTHGPSPSPP